MSTANSAKRRAQELGIALREGKKRNGSHLVRVVGGLLPPDPTLCQPCSSNFQCYLRGEQVTEAQAKEKMAPCLKGRLRIEFSYHDTVCITYDMVHDRVTDHGNWSWSQTTRQAIGWYLEALWEHDYLPSGEVIGFLKTCFKAIAAGKDPPWGEFKSKRMKDHPGEKWITAIHHDQEENVWFQL